jgi:hypothetical protein
MLQLVAYPLNQQHKTNRCFRKTRTKVYGLNSVVAMTLNSHHQMYNFHDKQAVRSQFYSKFRGKVFVEVFFFEVDVANKFRGPSVLVILLQTVFVF